MAKKDNKNKTKNSFSEKYIEKNQKKKKSYQNPTKTRIGKILIVILAIAMVGGTLFALTYAIIYKILH